MAIQVLILIPYAPVRFISGFPALIIATKFLTGSTLHIGEYLGAPQGNPRDLENYTLKSGYTGYSH